MVQLFGALQGQKWTTRILGQTGHNSAMAHTGVATRCTTIPRTSGIHIEVSTKRVGVHNTTVRNMLAGTNVLMEETSR